MTKVEPPDHFGDYDRGPFEEIIRKANVPDKMTSFFDFSKDVNKEGLLAKVLEKAGDAVLSYAEVRQLLFGTIREQMGQGLESLKLPFSGLVAAISDQALLMNLPTMAMGQSMMLLLAPLFVDGAVAAISKVIRPEEMIAVTKKEKAVENFLGSLIGLQIQTSIAAENKILIPTQNKSTIAFMTSEIEKAKEEFSTLFTVAEKQGWDTSMVASFKGAPDEALVFLQNLQPGEESYVLSLLGVWAVNRHVVEQALLKMPYEELRRRHEEIKGGLLHDPKNPVTDEQAKQLALAEQLMNMQPILANYMIIKDILDRVEESAEKYKAGKQDLLFRAAFEIKQIASGKTSAEYQYVGVMHTKLEQLSKTIAKVLPRTAQELDAGQVEVLTKAIQSCFQEIKSENPQLLTTILKSHPRTLLYLLSIHSQLVEDISMPALEVPEEKHLKGFEELIHKLSKWKAFSRYQPGSLRAILHELGHKIGPDIAKKACRIVYKSILEMITSLEADDASPLLDYLASFVNEE